MNRIISRFTPNNFGKSDIFKVTLIASGGLSGGFSSWIAGGKYSDGFRQGLITSGLNHAAHSIRNFIQKANSLVVVIYGAGGGDTVGNADFEDLIKSKGGELFTSSQPDGSTRFGHDGDNKIINYIQNNSKGKNVEIYCYSRGGEAVIRIVNKISSLLMFHFSLSTH